jgi:hypothetical protein
MTNYDNNLNELVAGFPMYDYRRIKRKPKKKIYKRIFEELIKAVIVVLFVAFIVSFEGIIDFIFA